MVIFNSYVKLPEGNLYWKKFCRPNDRLGNGWVWVIVGWASSATNLCSRGVNPPSKVDAGTTFRPPEKNHIKLGEIFHLISPHGCRDTLTAKHAHGWRHPPNSSKTTGCGSPCFAALAVLVEGPHSAQPAHASHVDPGAGKRRLELDDYITIMFRCW